MSCQLEGALSWQSNEEVSASENIIATWWAYRYYDDATRTCLEAEQGEHLLQCIRRFQD